ncbi:MAG: dihydropteroate synthase, partial [Terriglobia bacterium]
LPALPISIDTTKAEVAEEAVRAGADILNDISGLRFDPGMARVARTYNVPLVLMHLRGRPKTMQRKPFVKSIWRSLHEGLGTSVRRALSLGVRRSQLILDPGLGFGKSRRQNFEILANLHRLSQFSLPILTGASRKSFVQAVAAGEGLGRITAGRNTAWPLTRSVACSSLTVAGSGRTRGSSTPVSVATLDAIDAAITTSAILAGAHIVRVHNVAVILPAVRLADTLLATL